MIKAGTFGSGSPIKYFTIKATFLCSSSVKSEATWLRSGEHIIAENKQNKIKKTKTK